MAICPFAIWRPLPENKTEPLIDATQVVYHTAVDAKGPTSTLFHWFNSDGITVETHFYIRWDGTIEQYIDTRRQADGQRYGNIRAISIETEDDGNPTDNPWSSEQIASLVRLTKWLREEHPKIAGRVCRNWEDPGIGYHSMWGAPSPWTPSRGKTCPGAARIRQFPDVVKAALGEGPVPTNPDKDLTTGATEMLGLKRGDKGEDVRLLQIMISDIDPKALNSDRSIAHNGHWGPGTSAGLAKVIQRPAPVDYLGVWDWRRLWTAWTRSRVTGSTSVWTKDTGRFAAVDHKHPASEGVPDHTHPVVGKLSTGNPV